MRYQLVVLKLEMVFMKLSNKIIVRIVFGFIFILVLDGYITLNYELRYVNDDMKQDSQILGHAMQQVIQSAWNIKGEDYVFDLINQVNKKEHKIKLRWIWFDKLSKGDQQKLRLITQGKEVYLTKSEENCHCTYLPIQVNAHRYSAIELSKPLSDVKDYTKTSIVRLIILVVLLAIVSSFMVQALCVSFISNPLQKLVEKSQRIGAGSLSEKPILHSKDELAILDIALTEMCQQLSEEKEAKRLEAEARLATLEQLRHSERLALLGKLAAGVAHELGTPLNVVIGRAKMITYEDINKSEIIRSSKIIYEQAERMTKIIQQLLDFSRRRKHQMSLTNLNNLIREIIEILVSAAKKNNVSILFSENKDIPFFPLDPSQIQQVLINVIMNGIQAMADGGMLEIQLSSENKKGKEYAVIYVKDQGVGVVEQDLPLIFDPFFTTKEAGKGTGLGLSITYDIVKEHGGWLEVVSVQGKGTTFSIYLPMKEKNGKKCFNY